VSASEPEKTPGEVPPAAPKNPSRPWYDGAGKEKRLRVKGLVDLAPAALPERDAGAPDPGDVAEIHRASEKAIAEGDERALGKLYEDLLDSVHSKEGPKEEPELTPWAALKKMVPDYEAALAAEMRVLASADARWGWAYRLVDEGLEVRLRDPDGEGWACAVELRALVYAAATTTDARAFASYVVGRARREILNARTGALLGRPIPLVGVS
jgi:hypothetical protein